MWRGVQISFIPLVRELMSRGKVAPALLGREDFTGTLSTLRRLLAQGTPRVQVLKSDSVPTGLRDRVFTETLRAQFLPASMFEVKLFPTPPGGAHGLWQCILATVGSLEIAEALAVREPCLLMSDWSAALNLVT